MKIIVEKGKVKSPASADSAVAGELEKHINSAVSKRLEKEQIYCFKPVMSGLGINLLYDGNIELIRNIQFITGINSADYYNCEFDIGDENLSNPDMMAENICGNLIPEETVNMICDSISNAIRGRICSSGRDCPPYVPQSVREKYMEFCHTDFGMIDARPPLSVEPLLMYVKIGSVPEIYYGNASVQFQYADGRLYNFEGKYADVCNFAVSGLFREYAETYRAYAEKWNASFTYNRNNPHRLILSGTDFIVRDFLSMLSLSQSQTEPDKYLELMDAVIESHRSVSRCGRQEHPAKQRNREDDFGKRVRNALHGNDAQEIRRDIYELLSENEPMTVAGISCHLKGNKPPVSARCQKLYGKWSKCSISTIRDIVDSMAAGELETEQKPDAQYGMIELLRIRKNNGQDKVPHLTVQQVEELCRVAADGQKALDKLCKISNLDGSGRATVLISKGLDKCGYDAGIHNDEMFQKFTKTLAEMQI